MLNTDKFRKNQNKVIVFIVLITAISLACSITNIFTNPTESPSLPETATSTAIPPSPTPTHTPKPLPPSLLDSVPPPNAELPLDGPILLYFNQSMDKLSVEESISIEPPTKGAFVWVDDRTLEFSPDSSLSPNTQITFNLNTNIHSAQGMALPQPISLDYHTTGYLELTQSLPEANTKDVDPTSAIVAAFNRPVVALGADPDSGPPAFSLIPAAQGRGEWINTSTYIFYPQTENSPPLEGGKTYTVDINPQLKGTDGSPLETAESWSFTTALPRLVKVEQTQDTWKTSVDSSSLYLDSKLVFTFNQPMDESSVESNTKVLFDDSSSVEGSFTWNQDTTVFTYTPSLQLPRSSQFTLLVSSQATARGGTRLQNAYEKQVFTYPALRVYSSDPGEGGQKKQHGGIKLYFNAPVIKDDALDHISVNPSVPDLNTWWSSNDNALTIYGNFLPSTEYTLQVSSDLPDLWEGTLGEDFILNFQTSPLSPSFFIQGGTSTYFLTTGDKSIPAQATNLSSVSISLGSVPLNDFFTMRGPNGYEFRRNYQPADQISWQQSLDMPPNTNQNVNIYMTPDHESLDPGIYLLKLNFPFEDVRTDPVLITVSGNQLTFKLSATDALVWAVDIDNNVPLQDKPVSIFEEDGSVLAEGETNQDGIFNTSVQALEKLYNSRYAVIGHPGDSSFSLALSTWNQGISPWDFEIRTDSSPPHLEAYIYTDRPIYRPGQKVYYRAIVRSVYNGRYSLPDTGALTLKLSGSSGEEIDTFSLPLSTFGSAHGYVNLPSDAQPGSYWINCFDDDDDHLGSVSFDVSEYHKPEINLEVSFSESQILSGTDMSADINARYFFDAPAGNLPIEWKLYSTDSYFYIPGYRVGVVDTSWMEAYHMPFFGHPFGETIAEGQDNTSADGTLKLDLSSELNKNRKKYTLEITAKDESGYPISARTNIEVNPDQYYIGIRPDSWTGKSGAPFGFDIKTVDWDEQPLKISDLHAEFAEVTWVAEEIQPYAFDPSYSTITHTPVYTLVESIDFSTNNLGQAHIEFTPEKPGTYQLKVSGNQDDDQGASTETLIWVGGKGQAVWPRMPNQRLHLTVDRSDQENNPYKPGESAQVFIPNPFGESATALVTYERGIVLESKVISVDANGSNLDIPIIEDYAPNIFVSVTLLGYKSQNDETSRPDFRQGYAILYIEPEALTLNVDITSTPQQTGPGEDVQFEIQVDDSAGDPVQGEFSLSVVDKAVLALADPNAIDILPAYYGTQPLGVRTGLSLAAYAYRRLLLPPGLGGGGGGDDLALSVIREHFPDTALWKADVVTDEDGYAQVSVKLPDSLTTWQVDVRGITSDSRVGQALSEVITTKDLLIRPVVPRFFVAEDHIQLAAVAHNNTDNELSSEVSLQSSGFILDDSQSATQIISIPSNGRVRVEWWGTVAETESVDLIFSVEADNQDTASGQRLKDIIRPASGAIPVLGYLTPRTFSTSGILEGSDGENSQLELISLPPSISSSDGKGYGTLEVELSPSMAAALIDSLDYLEHYPYECTEQTLSRFLPNLEVYSALHQLGIESPLLKDRLERTLDEGISLLIQKQNSDGGWGWWKSGESNQSISAYVLFGLSRAKSLGVSVEENVLTSAVQYLLANVFTPQMVSESWQLDRLSLIYFSLSQAGEGTLAGPDSLFAFRDTLSPWAQALLGYTLEQLSPGNDHSETLFSDLSTSAIRSSTGAHWEGEGSYHQNMSSPISTSAMVVYALAQYDPQSPLLADAVRYLMAHRSVKTAWGSTYNTAWSLLALTEVMKYTGELGADFAFSATLNGVPLADGQAGGIGELNPVTASVPIENLYPDYPNGLLIQRETGSGRLYYTGELTVFQPVDSVLPLNQGIEVSRRYYSQSDTCSNEDCPSTQSAQSGENIIVKLTLTLKNAAYYLLVEDYIPAGAEILDTSLKTTQQGAPEEEVSLYDVRQPFKNGWGWWYFNDPQIYDEHIAWSVEHLPAGTYSLTYTLIPLQRGEFRVIPAHAWQFYFPEVQGNSAGTIFTIK